MRPKVKIKQVGPGFIQPQYMSSGASGMDLFAALGSDITLKPQERCLVPCGFSMELPEGYEAQVRPRSGLAVRNGITCLNTPGTIDQDYRGEIKIILVNFGKEDFIIRSGDRIAQMIICPVIQADLELSEQLGDTHRGVGGFGSTGS